MLGKISNVKIYFKGIEDFSMIHSVNDIYLTLNNLFVCFDCVAGCKIMYAIDTIDSITVWSDN